MRIKCMILDKPLHPDAVCLARLYPESSKGDGLQSVKLSVRDIDNDRMYLLLFRPIEEAYDRGALCFHPDRLHKNQLIIRILDPNLGKMKLMEAYEQSKRPPDGPVRSFVGPVVGDMTFFDIDGERLQHNGNLPYTRVLRLHAMISQIEAIQKKWIERKDIVPFRSMSPGADDFELFTEFMSEAPDSGDEGDGFDGEGDNEGDGEGDEDNEVDEKSKPQIVIASPSKTAPSITPSGAPSNAPSSASSSPSNQSTKPSKAKKRRDRKNKKKS